MRYTCFLFRLWLLLSGPLLWAQAGGKTLFQQQIDSLVELSTEQYRRGALDTALQTLSRAQVLAEVQHQPGEAVFCLANKGRLYLLDNKLSEARIWLDSSKAYALRSFGVRSLEYIGSLRRCGSYLIQNGHLKEARQEFEGGAALYEKYPELRHPYRSYLWLQKNLAAAVGLLGDYQRALDVNLGLLEEIPQDSISQYERAGLWINCGACYIYLGKYIQAEEGLQQARKILEAQTNYWQQEFYLSCLTNLAVVYQATGRLQSELQAKKSICDLLDRQGKIASPEGCNGLIGLASCQLRLGDHAAALGHYEQAKAILDSMPTGRSHRQYCLSLKGIGQVYSQRGEYEKAQSYYRQMLEHLKTDRGLRGYDYASGLLEMGITYYKQAQFQSAETILSESYALFDSLQGSESQESADCELQLGRSQLKNGKFEMAWQKIEHASQVGRHYLLGGSAYYSEAELYQLTQKNDDFIALMGGMLSLKTDALKAAYLYDYLLFQKGFIQHAVIRVRNQAMRDSASAVLYAQLAKKQSELSAALTERNSLPEQVQSLKTAANELEREVLAHLEDPEWRQQQGSVQIREALSTSEACIEFTHYRSQADSACYGALILRRDVNDIRFVKLCSEAELAALLKRDKTSLFAGINALYGREALQKLLIKPILPYLSGIKTLYYAPDGLLHRLSLGAIPMADKSILSDHFDLVLLNSTREVPAYKRKGQVNGLRTGASALLIGGVDYEGEAKPLAQATDQDGLTLRGELDFSFMDANLRQGSWPDLKWSLNEVEEIAQQFNRYKIDAELKTGKEAQESLFRDFAIGAAQKPAPDILHISSHGFFFPDPGNRQFLASEPVFKSSDNPMLRSGLLLSGSNRAWRGEITPRGQEDGILTAYEVSRLDLGRTGLVVLSACETGLGDILNTEGVYGLQRAFKIAGANKICMSLWQVPDFQTREFMGIFYRKLLSEHMSPRSALQATQSEMRKKRYEPFFWAGFVLVE